jgi:spermidine synthase
MMPGHQGESLWLHHDIIKELAAMCHEVFEGGSVQYAYTTIPTYPR